MYNGLDLLYNGSIPTEPIMIYAKDSLFVITYYIDNNINMFGDEVYTNKATAEEVAAKDKDLSVKTLSDYIIEHGDDRYSNGKEDERAPDWGRW